MRTANPALSEETFDKFARAGYFTDTASGRMTVEGTANKTGILLLLAVIAAAFTWSQVLTPGGAGLAGALALGGIIGGFIVAMVTIFNPKVSPYTAPVYAVLEGLALGAISAFANYRYPGIVPQTVGLTFAVMALMLVAYRSGWIKATEKFTLGLIVATGSIALIYAATLIMGLFGVHMPYIHDSGPIGIGFSLVVVGIAALNLILDFDLIESGARQHAPKFMEWYGAFSLMVTLVWLYLEILRLLSKLNSRR